MIKPVTFEEIVIWLKSKQKLLWVDKLGRRVRNGMVSHFFCSYEPNTNSILITGDAGLNGKKSSIYHFDKARWNAVMHFMSTLNSAEREVVKNYTNANIPIVNMVFRPNPPAICRAYYEEKGGPNGKN